MKDKILAKVTSIVDGDTFKIRVLARSRSNRHKYKRWEKVRISGIDTPETGEPGAKEATEELRQEIDDAIVICTIHARDVYNRIVADYEVLGDFV